MLIFFSNKSLFNQILKSHSKSQQPNQAIDLSEVLFNITADGCAFYSISFPAQPLF